MTALDEEIAAAIAKNATAAGHDSEAYGQAFRPSARRKAEEVTALLARSSERTAFTLGRPVFVSVGGADGEELIHLLKNTQARVGILLEGDPKLAAQARTRVSEVPGKRLEIIEGDAQARITDAVAAAKNAVDRGEGTFIAVTIHAVIHELYDRSAGKFDPITFFNGVFSARPVPTWLTYREPMVPPGWPDDILLKADCDPRNLLNLADLIRGRHKELKELQPEPAVVGGSVRLNKVLATEVIVKLSYLDGLAYELQERSSAVEHEDLTRTLDKVLEKDNAAIITETKTTESFQAHWPRLRLEAHAVEKNAPGRKLTMPESQKRVVCSCLPASASRHGPDPSSVLSLVDYALDAGDEAVASALIASWGRTLIESGSRTAFIAQLKRAEGRFGRRSAVAVWANFLISLDRLIQGEALNADWFAGERRQDAQQHGFDLLYRAEEMEFARKSGDLDRALKIANELELELPRHRPKPNAPGENFALGVANYMLGNTLRHGGRYSEARTFIGKASECYDPRIPAHATELAHCGYGVEVCAAMAGAVAFDVTLDLPEEGRLFASILRRLASSHAAWFLGDLQRAEDAARNAQTEFSRIHAQKHAERAQRLATLLHAWKDLKEGRDSDISNLEARLRGPIRFIIGDETAVEEFNQWVVGEKPSVVLGLLQFRKFRKGTTQHTLRGPSVLTRNAEGRLEWKADLEFKSLEALNSGLRTVLGIPLEQPLPLIAD